MKRLKVLVAEDSLTVRRLLVDILSSQADFEVVGEAENGKQAIELCQSLRPDVATLDMMMPVMSGLAATEYIMAYCPTPLLIVSSSTNRGELFKTYEALAAGALDILEKPTAEESNAIWEKRFLSALRRVARIKVITHPRAKLNRMAMGASAGADAAHPPIAPAPFPNAAVNSHPNALPNAWPNAAPSPIPARPPAKGIKLLAIGASTGGPGAVLEILKGLPKAFPIPILLVLHLGKVFGSAFAEWLDGLSPIRVSYALDGEALPMPGEGRLLLAPPDFHMTLRSGRIRLTQDAERHSCRPSVDALFESLARELGPSVAGCLLTGMGRDGAEGLLAIHRAGGATMAQNEETCVVFGMPREAILLGAAQRILPLSHIAPALADLAKGGTL